MNLTTSTQSSSSLLHETRNKSFMEIMEEESLEYLSPNGSCSIHSLIDYSPDNTDISLSNSVLYNDKKITNRDYKEILKVIPSMESNNKFIKEKIEFKKIIKAAYQKLDKDLKQMEENINSCSAEQLRSFKVKLKEAENLKKQLWQFHDATHKYYNVFQFKVSKIDNPYKKNKLSNEEINKIYMNIYQSIYTWSTIDMRELTSHEIKEIEEVAVKLIKRECPKDKLAALLNQTYLPSSKNEEVNFLTSDKDYENACKIMVIPYLFYNYELLCIIRKKYKFNPLPYDSNFQNMKDACLYNCFFKMSFIHLLPEETMRDIDRGERGKYDIEVLLDKISYSRCYHLIEHAIKINKYILKDNMKSIDEHKTYYTAVYSNFYSRLNKLDNRLKTIARKKAALDNQGEINFNQPDFISDNATAPINQLDQTSQPTANNFSKSELKKQRSKENREKMRRQNVLTTQNSAAPSIAVRSTTVSNNAAQSKQAEPISPVRQEIRAATEPLSPTASSNTANSTTFSDIALSYNDEDDSPRKKERRKKEIVSSNDNYNYYDQKFQSYYIRYNIEQDAKLQKIDKLKKDFPGIPTLAELQVMPDEDVIKKMAYHNSVMRCETSGLPFPEKNPNLPPPENEGYTYEDLDNVLNLYCPLKDDRLARKALKIAQERCDNLDLPLPDHYEEQDVTEALKLSNHCPTFFLRTRDDELTNILFHDPEGFTTDHETARYYKAFLDHPKEITEMERQRGWSIVGQVRGSGGTSNTIIKIKSVDKRLFLDQGAIVIDPHSARILVIFRPFIEIHRGQQGLYSNIYKDLEKKGLNRTNINPLLEHDNSKSNDPALLNKQREAFMQSSQGIHATQSTLMEIYENYHDSDPESILLERNQAMQGIK